MPRKAFDTIIKGYHDMHCYVEIEVNGGISRLPEGFTSKCGYIKDEFKKVWFNEDGYYHRLSGPAVEYANEHKEWYRNGKLHREDGPAPPPR